jgi:hypothetical protein
MRLEGTACFGLEIMKLEQDIRSSKDLLSNDSFNMKNGIVWICSTYEQELGVQ